MKKTIYVVIILLIVTLVLSVKAQGQFVGSKESNVYHYLSCSYVSSIKTENKIWFVDAQDAVNRGYHPCSRCNPPLPASNSPSPSPTISPTLKPTLAPTQTPSPTPSPTLKPTSTPTPTSTLPSPEPTPNPSPTPTISITTEPTPTILQTTPPSSSPSSSPTSSPPVPEYNLASLLLVLMIISSAVLITKKTLKRY